MLDAQNWEKYYGSSHLVPYQGRYSYSNASTERANEILSNPGKGVRSAIISHSFGCLFAGTLSCTVRQEYECRDDCLGTSNKYFGRQRREHEWHAVERRESWSIRRQHRPSDNGQRGELYCLGPCRRWYAERSIGAVYTDSRSRLRNIYHKWPRLCVRSVFRSIVGLSRAT